MQSRPRLDLYLPDGKLMAAVGPGAGMKFVEAYFPEVEKELLIGTAYFSLRGYALARKHVPDAALIHFLVGKGDGHLVQKAVLEEIREQLCEVQREMDHPRDLYAAVEDILDRLKNRRFRIADARQMMAPFHCKIYIVHAKLAWHGSANFSVNGLTGQTEQTTVILDPVHVRLWRDWFREVAATAHDLHEKLIDLLEAWLEMADPFDVYLKALLHLLDMPDLQRERGALSPVYYQKRLAAWAVRQLDAQGGALLVVATGLGKTIIGAEVAGLLRATDEIGHVILLAPCGVHSAWKTQLQGRGVPFDVFDNRLLFNKDSDKGWRQISRLTALFRTADSRTLILVDEAHFYRNQLLAHRNGGSLVIQRVDRAVKQDARIVLMTGSAYGTNVQNLDSLLYLLPHRNPDTLEGEGPWQAVSYQHFSRLPPVAVLGYPHVVEMAHQRGDVEDGYPFVELGSGTRQYLPTTLRTQIVTYELPLEDEVAAAFKDRFFDQDRKMPTLGFSDEEGQFTTMTDTVYNVALKGWLSSPRELIRCIDKNLETEGPLDQARLFDEGSHETPPDGQVNLSAREEHGRHRKVLGRDRGYTPKLGLHIDTRRPPLQLLRQHLAHLQNEPDDKAKRLLKHLQKRREAGPLKVIIFVEQLVTALHLKKILRDQMPSLHVACTVKSTGTLEESHIRADLLKRFSPGSHGEVDGSGTSFDVLICTDADGIGVNLQDADTVVNYDLTAAGADRLVQRLGRIMRPTARRERILHVFTFLPACVTRSVAQGDVYRRIRGQYERLFDRHDKSSEILGSRILAADGRPTTIHLNGEVDVPSLFEAGYPLERINRDESLAAHLTVLEGHRQQAKALPHTLHSTRYYDGAESRLVVLIRCGGRYHPLVVEPKSQRLVSEDALEALNLLACPPEEPLAEVLSFIAVPDILDAADEAIRRWCDRHGESLDGVQRAAALYILPRL